MIKMNDKPGNIVVLSYPPEGITLRVYDCRREHVSNLETCWLGNDKRYEDEEKGGQGRELH